MRSRRLLAIAVAAWLATFVPASGEAAPTQATPAAARPAATSSSSGSTLPSVSAASSLGRRTPPSTTRGAVAPALPSRADVNAAIGRYLRDPASARARQPMMLHEFFGREIKSSNVGGLRVEVLKGAAGRTIAFVHHDSPHETWGGGSRHNDVKLFRLVESLEAGDNPFPHAISNEDGTTLVRVWDDFRTVEQGPPPELSGAALRTEVARMSIWSYVTGNVDGPAVNPGNGGFARVLGADGAPHWRGVLLDAQLALSEHADWGDGHVMIPPWGSAPRVWDAQASQWRDAPPKAGILGLGPVEHVPPEVGTALVRIAENPSRRDLATRAGFDPTNPADIAKMAAVRARAQEVLTHYGIGWHHPA